MDQKVNLEAKRFPIGRFKRPDKFDFESVKKAIQNIEELPEKLLGRTLAIDPEELLKTYREDGWNVQQIIHHFADSHMNSFIRFKLALTEDNPTIKPYNESAWAEMQDVDTEIEDSIMILKGVHTRWVKVLKSMSEEDFHRSWYHPEAGASMKLYEAVEMYSWHCSHHWNHIKMALDS